MFDALDAINAESVADILKKKMQPEIDSPHLTAKLINMEQNMPEELIPMIIVPVFFGTIAFVIKTLSDNRVKRELINMRADKETIDFLLLQSPMTDREASLKWGIVAVALGVGLALIQVLGLGGEEPLAYALMFIFGGGGLLAHYALKGNAPARD